MPYTEEEGGILNNFAIEPKVYQAKPPNATQKRNYAIQAVLALLLVGGLLALTVVASNLG
ncbi:MULTISPECIES: photosystem II assembly protein Psb34 [Planktothricoides]|jgi:hypothetical protein|uniref:Ssl1498 family light-harvesting-like protein n=2 Tax=Planktothricoides raciborskii TaxID=132608 RepID=A0AAU8JKU8_9CYAN|nr:MULTISPECIES: ssl1498 family light-harvesting-like protein [Planktothricoides]KOR34302.1 hypothetical protein AM228_24900 [Planktothricoides sp. SR001]MBD2547257.1 ssl1498 family light-harvesting-like protein [Planktothricoides raciborskii FACHB-1370]MBD2585759.1 ssl1498 family light-harvesting-like protein [Planktothricoides raciborskii FACHB-1261]